MKKGRWIIGIGAVVMSMGILGTSVLASNGQSELAQVRKATAKYHNVEAALADGYIPIGPAIEVPGVGTMGYHYINFAELTDSSINPETPEVLLYTSTKDQKDGVRLVGVEYVVAADDWSGSEPPSIFGQPFEGPMDGHGPGEPRHYDKHVWLWQANPKGVNEPIWVSAPGIFLQFNPNVQCDNCTPADDSHTDESHSH